MNFADVLYAGMFCIPRALGGIVLIGRSWVIILFAAVLALEQMASAAGAAPPRVEDAEANLTITLGSERLGWGEELEVTVSATNLSRRKQAGGIYLSFDFDVLVLAATDARVLQPGDVAYDLRSSSARPLVRPLVEVWIADWSPQAEHKMVVTVLPLAGSRLRVLARTTMLQSGSTATLSIHPSLSNPERWTSEVSHRASAMSTSRGAMACGAQSVASASASAPSIQPPRAGSRRRWRASSKIRRASSQAAAAAIHWSS